jgi:hypothetical protein
MQSFRRSFILNTGGKRGIATLITKTGCVQLGSHPWAKKCLNFEIRTLSPILKLNLIASGFLSSQNHIFFSLILLTSSGEH